MCSKYRKSEKPKISYLLEETLVISIICSKHKNEDEKIFKENESIEILKIFGLIENKNILKIWLKKFRLKNIDQIRNYLIEEVNRNKLMNKKHKKVCATLHYIKHFLILASTISGRVSISDFTSLIGIPIEITSSEIGLIICAIAAGKKYKSIIKKNKKNLDKIILLAKSELNSIEVLISKV